MLLTVYSSFSFAVTSYYGYLYNDWMGNWFAILTLLSLLNHSTTTNKHTRLTENKIILTCDRTIAHLIYARTLIDAIIYHLNTDYLTIYWLCSLWVFYAFKVAKLPEIHGIRGEFWDVTTHIAGATGCTCLLFHKQLFK
jgi:hypothetical protein